MENHHFSLVNHHKSEMDHGFHGPFSSIFHMLNSQRVSGKVVLNAIYPKRLPSWSADGRPNMPPGAHAECPGEDIKPRCGNAGTVFTLGCDSKTNVLFELQNYMHTKHYKTIYIILYIYIYIYHAKHFKTIFVVWSCVCYMHNYASIDSCEAGFTSAGSLVQGWCCGAQAWIQAASWTYG